MATARGAALLAALACGVPAPAAAAAPACVASIALAVDGETLSAVLHRLGRELGFQVRYWAAEDPALRLRMVGQPTDVMRRLADHASMGVRYRRTPRGCATALMIDAVWVVPGSAGAAPMAPFDPITDWFARAHGAR